MSFGIMRNGNAHEASVLNSIGTNANRKKQRQIESFKTEQAIEKGYTQSGMTGAGAGASIGMMVGGPIGAGIGAVGGFIGGYLADYFL